MAIVSFSAFLYSLLFSLNICSRLRISLSLPEKYYFKIILLLCFTNIMITKNLFVRICICYHVLETDSNYMSEIPPKAVLSYSYFIRTLDIKNNNNNKNLCLPLGSSCLVLIQSFFFPPNFFLRVSLHPLFHHFSPGNKHNCQSAADSHAVQPHPNWGSL